jgi:hypothetical protein
VKSTTHKALGRLTRNSRFTLSSGQGALGLLTVVIVVFPRLIPGSRIVTPEGRQGRGLLIHHGKRTGVCHALRASHRLRRRLGKERRPAVRDGAQARRLLGLAAIYEGASRTPQALGLAQAPRLGSGCDQSLHKGLCRRAGQGQSVPPARHAQPILPAIEVIAAHSEP